MKLCPNCGSSMKPDDQYCGECGAQARPDRSQAPVVAPEVPAPTARRSTLLVSAVVIVALMAIGLYFFTKRSAAEMQPLDGSVLIFHEVNFVVNPDGSCEGTGALFDLVPGSPVRITPSKGNAVWSELVPGFITDEGNCRLKFSATIPESENYTFEIGGREPVAVKRLLIDHPGGWWITLDWDAMSPIPNA